MQLRLVRPNGSRVIAPQKRIGRLVMGKITFQFRASDNRSFTATVRIIDLPIIFGDPGDATPKDFFELHRTEIERVARRKVAALIKRSVAALELTIDDFDLT